MTYREWLDLHGLPNTQENVEAWMAQSLAGQGYDPGEVSYSRAWSELLADPLDWSDMDLKSLAEVPGIAAEHVGEAALAAAAAVGSTITELIKSLLGGAAGALEPKEWPWWVWAAIAGGAALMILPVVARR